MKAETWLRRPFLMALLACPVMLLAQQTPPTAGEAEDGPEERVGTVTSNILNVRARPATHFEVVGQLKQGDKVTVVGEKDEWREIVAPPQTKAWIAARFIDSNGCISAERIRVHSGPGLVFTTFAQVDKGQKVTLVGTPLNGWQRIEAPPGATVWVSSAYVHVPEPEPPPAEEVAADEAPKGEQIAKKAPGKEQEAEGEGQDETASKAKDDGGTEAAAKAETEAAAKDEAEAPQAKTEEQAAVAQKTDQADGGPAAKAETEPPKTEAPPKTEVAAKAETEPPKTEAPPKTEVAAKAETEPPKTEAPPKTEVAAKAETEPPKTEVAAKTPAATKLADTPAAGQVPAKDQPAEAEAKAPATGKAEAASKQPDATAETPAGAAVAAVTPDAAKTPPAAPGQKSDAAAPPAPDPEQTTAVPAETEIVLAEISKPKKPDAPTPVIKPAQVIREGVLFALRAPVAEVATHFLAVRIRSTCYPICYLYSEHLDLNEWELHEVRAHGHEIWYPGWKRPVIEVRSIQLNQTY